MLLKILKCCVSCEKEHRINNEVNSKSRVVSIILLALRLNRPVNSQSDKILKSVSFPCFSAMVLNYLNASTQCQCHSLQILHLPLGQSRQPGHISRIYDLQIQRTSTLIKSIYWFKKKKIDVQEKSTKIDLFFFLVEHVRFCTYWMDAFSTDMRVEMRNQINRDTRYRDLRCAHPFNFQFRNDVEK